MTGRSVYNFNDRTGQRYGRLVALGFERRTGKDGRARIFWNCACDCGNSHAVDTDALRSGRVVSCGCRQREAGSERLTHGASNTDMYWIWNHMIRRCSDPGNRAYRNYGGRGIKVCDRWRESFEAFASDMGPRPSKTHSIDRYPDMNGNYEPGNVRWATALEQGRNRRGLVTVTFNGREMCLKEAAQLAGISYGTVHARIVKHGWPTDKALSTPARRACA